MSESHLEQRPLLCDECSDEELRIQDTSLRFQRRFRHLTTTGRAKTHAIGAATIITRWPDHLSSLLTYWWMGLGMIAVMVFIMYNSIVSVVMLRPTHNKLLKVQNPKYTESKFHENSSVQDMYMHVFVSNYDEFSIKNYLPYIGVIAKKFPNFKYNFIIASNDISQDIVNDLSDEEKNEMALNLLWSDQKIKSERKQYENCTITFISLTKYMDNSPLKKYWRLIPFQFIGFLARCIAIWDKGGVAFNPSILTPNTPNSVHLDKLNSILDNFQYKTRLMSTKKKKISKKYKKKLNNIRDIINNLENGDQDANMYPDDLYEAEQIQAVTITPLKDKRNAKLFSFDKLHSQENILIRKDEALNKNNSIKEDVRNTSSNLRKTTKVINSTQVNDTTAKQNLLPKFLEFLFHMNSKNFTTVSENLKNSSRETLLEFTQVNDLLNYDVLPTKTPTKVKVLNEKTTTKSNNNIFSENESMKLIIDLKGNLIATNTACHAFIGTVFNNVIHHTDEESLTDLIIAELSLFCKGSLSTCNGVEVISL